MFKLVSMISWSHISWENDNMQLGLFKATNALIRTPAEQRAPHKKPPTEHPRTACRDRGPKPDPWHLNQLTWPSGCYRKSEKVQTKVGANDRLSVFNPIGLCQMAKQLHGHAPRVLLDVTNFGQQNTSIEKHFLGCFPVCLKLSWELSFLIPRSRLLVVSQFQPSLITPGTPHRRCSETGRSLALAPGRLWPSQAVAFTNCPCWNKYHWLVISNQISNHPS